jgi:hypothetical protein
MTEALRTEQEVVGELSTDERAYLKRVLELERARLHVTNPDLTEELLDAVKRILP